MEPTIIDYYNEMPKMVYIIDAMNQELTDVQKKYEELQKKYTILEKKSNVHCKYFWGFKITEK